MPKHIIYTYDQMKLDYLQATISLDRLKAYTTKTMGNRVKALELYLWNIALSESLYGPLQSLEVSLRNALNRELCTKYGPDWYKMAKPALFSENQANCLTEAIKKFDKSRSITVSDVVASVSFGFWTDILYFEMYEKLWRKCTCNAFPNRPKGTKRSKIALIVKRLKGLRNRVAHHEPIWNRDLAKDHDSIIDILHWICPVTGDWVNHHSRFNAIWNDPPSI